MGRVKFRFVHVCDMYSTSRRGVFVRLLWGRMRGGLKFRVSCVFFVAELQVAEASLRIFHSPSLGQMCGGINFVSCAF